jgi:hypothetical protein
MVCCRFYTRLDIHKRACLKQAVLWCTLLAAASTRFGQRQKLMSAAGGGNNQPVDAVQLGRYATETFAA